MALNKTQLLSYSTLETMKTAIGYFFLALGATFAGVALTVVFFALTGKLQALDHQATYDPLHRTALIAYSIFHVGVIFPLFYFGVKWIKKEVNYTSPPTGKGAVS
ncbi:MAG: hypothetical protein JWM14_2313 [Chitinophagaceae bacterium]|nr:hypothetical protein [Chitinophagaceae bacterium]